jgi:GTP cyclohydrolase I
MKTDSLSTQKISKSLSDFDFDEIGDEHLYTGLQTPMREDAFALTNQQKKEKIAHLFEQIMHVMGLALP